MSFDAGLSFQPNAQPSQQNAGGDAGPTDRGANPVQDAIRILSLRLPRVVGQAPTSGALLNGPGMAGLGAGFAGNPANFMALLQRFISGQGGPGTPAGAIPNVGFVNPNQGQPQPTQGSIGASMPQWQGQTQNTGITGLGNFNTSPQFSGTNNADLPLGGLKGPFNFLPKG